jgi:hypothetical protein
MRAIVGVAGLLSTLFLGFFALSQQAQRSAPVNNSTALYNTSYNLTTNVAEGTGAGLASAAPYFGVAAVVLIAVGILYKSGGGR